MSRPKEYLVRADLNPEYIMYIGYVFGRYAVFVTNETHTRNYSVYGPYQRIGDAANRLKASAVSYKSNTPKFWYMSKAILHNYGPFPDEKQPCFWLTVHTSSPDRAEEEKTA